MNGIDPTIALPANITGFKGRLSVEAVAAMQAHEIRMAEAMAGIAESTTEGGERQPSALETASSLAAAQVSPTMRDISGRYRSGGGIHVELRVDVDGDRPLRRVSADYYTANGASYYGSFMVDAPSITVTTAYVVITGLGVYTWNAGAPKVRITIPRVLAWSQPAAATLQHLTLSDAPGASYVCSFASPYFRTVEIEQDRVESVTAFASYDVGLLPSGGSRRPISVLSAYQEAGIEMRPVGASDIVPIGDAGVNGIWSNAELHASMIGHFSLWQDDPQWRVWLFHAQLHDIGPGLLGIMFDQIGRQRQGAATFYQSQAGPTPSEQRSQLYTCVHELGHCFNLFHSFHKEFMSPPQLNRPDALSWMNYPQNYPYGGASAFWNDFPFQFDDLELIHLRHAFRDNIVFGANDFGVGAALENLDSWRPAGQNHSDLKLDLQAPASFATGEPVSIGIKLRATGAQAKRVHNYLSPEYGLVQIGIRKPSGQVQTYRPLIRSCIADEGTILKDSRSAVEGNAYIGYGQHGFYFDQPGIYRICAVYTGFDGEKVLSNVLNMRVRAPQNAEDEEVADLLFGQDQGTLLYLMGSDAPELKGGNEAFDDILEKHSKHTLANYARLVKGINTAREFKVVTTSDKLHVRKPKHEEAKKLLAPLLDVTEARAALSSLVEREVGAPSLPRASISRVADIVKKTALSPQSFGFIQARAAEIAVEIATDR
jgi:hypothetical protein